MFKPLCLNKNINQAKPFGHSARGFLLPCCWMEKYDDDEQLGNIHEALFNNNLALSNVKDIDEILLSDEWLAFNVALRKKQTAPPRCIRKCSGVKNKTFLRE